MYMYHHPIHPIPSSPTSQAQVEAELAKPDGCFQGAPETLTPPALALAALFAPAVCPPEYSGKFAPDAWVRGRWGGVGG